MIDEKLINDIKEYRSIIIDTLKLIEKVKKLEKEGGSLDDLRSVLIDLRDKAQELMVRSLIFYNLPKKVPNLREATSKLISYLMKLSDSINEFLAGELSDIILKSSMLKEDDLVRFKTRETVFTKALASKIIAKSSLNMLEASLLLFNDTIDMLLSILERN